MFTLRAKKKLVDNMSKLVMKNIYIDPTDWELLGDKVGDRGRSDFIRRKIREEVCIPDDLEGLREERKKTEKKLDVIKSKEDKIMKTREEQISRLGEIGDREEQAKELINNILEENTKIAPENWSDELLAERGQSRIEKLISKKEIKEITDMLEIDFDNMLSWTESQTHVKIVKAKDEKPNKRPFDITNPKSFA